MTTQQSIEKTFADWQKEEKKFSRGNATAGTRARKHLSELMKLAKARRVEIQAAKDAEKGE